MKYLSLLLVIINFYSFLYSQNYVHTYNGKMYFGNNPIVLKGANFWAYSDAFPEEPDYPYGYNYFDHMFN